MRHSTFTFKPIVRSVDGGLILTLALALFSAIPLVLNPRGLPNGSDVLYHTFRVAELDRSWSHGVLWPRWAEGMYYGYGSPLFHYYASLTYILTSVAMRLFALAPLEVLRAFIVACNLLGAGGMYAFVRGYSGKAGGIIAGLAYVYTPYLLYTEPYARGAYPELLAFALFPLILWRFDALWHAPHGRNVLLAALALGALILAHNLMALALTALLALWLLWRTALSWAAQRALPAPAVPAFLALGCGVGLTAFFWLPVILEGAAVNLQNLTGVALLDYRNFFVPLVDLLALPPRADAGAINGLANVYQLGWPQWLLALGGALTAIRQRAWVPLFFAAVAALMLALITPVSAPLWEALGVLAYLQFPWRFLGPVAVCLAILAGFNALWLERLSPRVGYTALAIITAAIIIGATPLFYVPEWRNTDVDTSISGYHAEEVAGRQLGTTFTDEYRPRAVYSLADPTPALLADYADGYPVDKLHRAALPPQVNAVLLDNGPQHNRWRVSAPQAFRMEVLTFYWDGWVATVDGQPLPITPSPNHGFITFDVPAGEHEVRVFLGSTPARDWGKLLSLAALIFSALLFWRLGGSPRPQELAPLSAGQRAALIAGGLGALVWLALALRPGIAWYASPPGTALPAAEPAAFQLGDDFRIIGYTLNSRVFRPGDRLALDVYWYPLRTSNINFNSFLHISAGGPPIAQADKLHPGGRAIREWWTPDGYILDEYRLTLPPDMPAGEYALYIGLYTYEPSLAGDNPNGYRPPVTNADGQPLGDAVPLGTIRVQ